jgi:hypothetical protein
VAAGLHYNMLDEVGNRQLRNSLHGYPIEQQLKHFKKLVRHLEVPFLKFNFVSEDNIIRVSEKPLEKEEILVVSSVLELIKIHLQSLHFFFFQLRQRSMTTMTTSFKDLGVEEWLIDSLNSISIKIPTEIQTVCVPEILKDKNVIASAKTGSGKTVH